MTTRQETQQILQVTGYFDFRCLPWECRDLRDGCTHTFKVIEDARSFAKDEGLELRM